MKRPVSSPLNDEPAAMADRELLAAYQRTRGEPGDPGDPGDPEVETIIAEIERRALDI